MLLVNLYPFCSELGTLKTPCMGDPAYAAFDDDWAAATVLAHPSPWQLAMEAPCALSVATLYGPRSSQLQLTRQVFHHLLVHVGIRMAADRAPPANADHVGLLRLDSHLLPLHPALAARVEISSEANTTSQVVQRLSHPADMESMHRLLPGHPCPGHLFLVFFFDVVERKHVLTAQSCPVLWTLTWLGYAILLFRSHPRRCLCTWDGTQQATQDLMSLKQTTDFETNQKKTSP